METQSRPRRTGAWIKTNLSRPLDSSYFYTARPELYAGKREFWQYPPQIISELPEISTKHDTNMVHKV